MNKEKIGLFIAKLRKDKKMTQEQLAERLYVDRGTISKWERGVYIPNPEMLGTLSKEFNVSVNEILAGEIKTKDNSSVVDNVAIEIMRDSNKKFKKIILSFSAILIVFLIGFLLYYFFNTYNSISVYRINGETSDFYVGEGIMVVSHETSYIKLGSIVSHLDKEIQTIRLYYLKNDEEHNIVTRNDTNVLLINTFGYDELFSYSDLNYIKSNLYLEVVTDSTNQKIKLDLKKDFSNKNLFSKKENYISINEDVDIDNNIPSYIVNNFKYNEEERYYYLKEKKKGVKINKTYLIDANVFIIDIDDNGILEHWEYSIISHSLSYYRMNDNEIINTFIYDFNENKCIDQNCNQEKITYFINNFFKYIK